MTPTAPPAATQVLRRPGEAPVLLVRRAQLTVRAGPAEGTVLPLDKLLVRIGKDVTNDLVLDDAAVSARHCELRLGEDGVLLHDLGSTNGTYVAGLRVRQVYLEEGVEIRLGESVLRFEVQRGETELQLSSATNFGALLGQSPAMRAAFAVLERAAATSSTVLIEAESGTGKELAARALHDKSARRDGPYVVIDCSSIPATLIESYLFGHERGAFTGAAAARRGAFEEADGGTLVLDEIGELPLELQPKLLRAVEARSIQRLGEAVRRDVDVRLVACTNRSLRREVDAGRFRADLYYRLAVISVSLPALRERPEEIPRLIAHFLQQLGGDPAREVPRPLLDMLMSHAWPGNVRELRNVVERLLVLPDLPPAAYLQERAIASNTEPSPALASMPFHEAKEQCTDRFERQYLSELLRRCGGNVSEIARVSGLSRQSCHRLISKHGLG